MLAGLPALVILGFDHGWQSLLPQANAWARIPDGVYPDRTLALGKLVVAREVALVEPALRQGCSPHSTSDCVFGLRNGTLTPWLVVTASSSSPRPSMDSVSTVRAM